MKSIFASVLLCLIVISVCGCASSKSTNADSISSADVKPAIDARGVIIAPWGTNELALMKAAQELSMEHVETERLAGSITSIEYTSYWSGYKWGRILKLFDGKYGSIEFYYGSHRNGQYDLYVKLADDIDSEGRLLFRTSSGIVAVEKTGPYSLRFTNKTIANMR